MKGGDVDRKAGQVAYPRRVAHVLTIKIKSLARLSILVYILRNRAVCRPIFPDLATLMSMDRFPVQSKLNHCEDNLSSHLDCIRMFAGTSLQTSQNLAMPLFSANFWCQPEMNHCQVKSDFEPE